MKIPPPHFRGRRSQRASADSRARLKQSLKSSGNTAAGAEDIRALTLAIRRGDAAAFARFYDLYSFRLYRFLLVLARGDENTARRGLPGRHDQAGETIRGV